MAEFEVPLSVGLFNYEIRMEVEGIICLFRFRWNTRADGGAGAWFLDVSDADGTLIAAGRKCLVEESLLKQYKATGKVPPGTFMAYDTTRRQLDPTVSDFGTRVLLLYIDSAGLAEAAAEAEAA